MHRKRASQRYDRQLWEQAAKALKEDNDSKMDLSVLNGPLPINDVHATVQQKLDQCVRKRWVYTRSNGEKVVLYKILEQIVKWVNKFKEMCDITMQYDPLMPHYHGQQCASCSRVLSTVSRHSV